MENKRTSFQLFSLVLFLISSGCGRAPEEQTRTVSSPDGKITVTFLLEKGSPQYRVSRLDQEIIKPSRLGFVFKDADPLDRNLEIADSRLNAVDDSWEQPWGEVRQIRNHYNELRVELREATQAHRKMNVVFRVYDDGLGFRYELPEQENLKDFQIMDEETEFVLTGPHPCWWIPALRDNRYEYLYKKSPIDQIDTVHTPLTIETREGLLLSIHEANLTDYASMTLRRSGPNTLACDLVPWSDGVKVKASTPHPSPWRTIQIAEKPGDLVTSYLILNLNEPNRLGDVSWVRPGKYVGIWWGMHLGVYTWESGPKHGATTARTRRYIDFAARNGFSGVLVEGWNQGWDGDWQANSDLFNFTTPYPDYDLEALTRYAASKGVKIIGHNETSAGIDNYERQLEDAFQLYRKLGIDTVKTGYVGSRANKTEWHHGQYMVRHYRKVVETAAKYHIMLDVHEPIKATGIRRTYPNMLSREGARGQEFNAWSEDGGNPPQYTTLLPFTRLLGGPFDFTPGIFDLLFEKERPHNRVNTTLAKQLALYVVIYSPLQMAADLPENYEKNRRPFQFIQDVPVDWEETRVVDAVIGDYVTIVRKDRHSGDWYLGSISDENGRTLQAPLSFLESDRKYVAEIYADGDQADWESNPLSIQISKRLVDHNTTLSLKLAPGGGQAIRIRPTREDEAGRIALHGR
ncbi:MAG: glycoside hydrolase family 97 protein [Acidobacteriota bacterium]